MLADNHKRISLAVGMFALAVASPAGWPLEKAVANSVGWPLGEAVANSAGQLVAEAMIAFHRPLPNAYIMERVFPAGSKPVRES